MKTKNMVKKKKKKFGVELFAAYAYRCPLCPLEFYIVFSSGTIKDFNGQMRQLYVYVTNKHTFGNYCLNTLLDTRGSEWGLVFSVICPYF